MSVIVFSIRILNWKQILFSIIPKKISHKPGSSIYADLSLEVIVFFYFCNKLAQTLQLKTTQLYYSQFTSQKSRLAQLIFLFPVSKKKKKIKMSAFWALTPKAQWRFYFTESSFFSSLGYRIEVPISLLT